jgi:hypothetical protein
MRAFLGSVLSIIAVGVLLIAYGLLSPRVVAAPSGAPTTDAYSAGYPAPIARPMPVNDIVSLGQPVTYDPDAASRAALAYPVNDVRALPAVRTSTAVRRAAASHVDRAPGRDWKKAALIVGGTTAASAGLGAIFGGGKGALIGAAIGGGASTIYEATRH